MKDKETIGLLSLENFADAWIIAVEDYTGRHLTEEGDKLLAISGFARLQNLVASLTYAAGLWTEWLMYGLCWHTSYLGRYFDDLPFFKLWPRPKRYRAPLWSWAAIDGQYRWDHGAELEANFEFRAKVLDCHIELTDPQFPHGAVVDGKLEVSGTMLKCDCIVGKDVAQLLVYAQSMVFVWSHPLPVTIVANTLESWTAICEDVWFLLLARHDPEPIDLEGQQDQKTGEHTTPAQFVLESVLEQSLQRRYPQSQSEPSKAAQQFNTSGC
jgi:hypothetical protein